MNESKKVTLEITLKDLDILQQGLQLLELQKIQHMNQAEHPSLKEIYPNRIAEIKDLFKTLCTKRMQAVGF